MKRIVFSVIASIICISLQAQNQSQVQDQAPAKLTFEDAVKIGLKNNVLLNQQKNQLEVNQAQKLNAVGNFIPGVNVQGYYQHQTGQQPDQTTGDLVDSETDNAGYQLNANLPIFNGLGRYNTLKSADNQLSAQGYLVKRSSQDVIFNVATQYLRVLLDQELLRIAEENHKAQQTLLDKIQASFDVGSRAITDVYAQDAIVKGLQVVAIRAKNDLENDKSILSQTLQLDPAQTFEAVYPTFTQDYANYKSVSVDSLIQVALANRPDLVQANHQVQSNKFFMRSQTGRFMPSLSAFANYGSYYYSLIDGDFQTQIRSINPSLTYGLSLNIPILTQFQTRAQKVSARILYENSELTRQNVEKTVKLDVQRAYNNYVNAIEGYTASLSQFQSGQQALQTQEESYLLGISDQAALAQSNQVFVLAASSKAQAEVNLMFQKVLLDYALGTIRSDEYEQN
ncbi:MAG TPA: TolC family protein [Chryseolinea sp.]|nr:TolC family protein [Chryseolinea sp.]